MKAFFRTTIGKTCLFLLTVLFFLSTAFSVLCFVGMAGFNTYSQSEEQAFQIAMDDQAESAIYYLLHEYIHNRRTPHNFDTANYVYTIYDESGKKVDSTVQGATEDWSRTMYFTLYNEEANPDLISEPATHALTWAQREDTTYFSLFPSKAEALRRSELGTPILKIEATLTKDVPLLGFSRFTKVLLHMLYQLRTAIYPLSIISVLGLIFSFVGLMSVSGRRPNTDELVPGPLHKVPFDLFLAVEVIVGVVFPILLFEPHDFSDVFFTIIAIALVLLYFCLGLGTCMSFATRIKDRSLLRNTLCYKVLRGCWNILRALLSLINRILQAFPIYFWALVLFGGDALFSLLMVLAREPWVLLVEKTLFVLLMLYGIYSMKKLEAVGEAIATGHPSPSVVPSDLAPPFRKHAQNLTSIEQGINLAVENRMQSERMRTELITNVSHDLKTPLTSLINYSDLILQEKTNNKKIHEYAEVLHRQSERMKKLIDDLLEASKAATGNLEAHPEPCDLGLALNQSIGEYQERFESRKLTIVTELPEEPLRILADGRHLGRIIDNLLSNIYKYALENTRVYITAVRQGDWAVLVLKNTSSEALNYSPDELMERFVRGDMSRNTDGSGLGLSIAKSLTELQGGTFNLATDGDLFKAILTFPLTTE